jgi:O-antigen/teichoic acid export membrane protein
MIKRRQILLNALTTFLQIACNAVILFVLYRFLIRAIGLRGLGIWSLVLAATSLVALANQGFSTGIVKFVAKYAARKAAAEVSALLQTAEISVGLALALLLIPLYPVAKWALGLLLPHDDLAMAYAVLPYALGSLWISVIGSVLQAGLAGHELITFGNYVDLSGSALYLLLAFALVPAHGLLGLAYAQVAQAVVCSLALWILLKRRVSELPFLPCEWNRSLFREMAAYGVHFQLITASQAIREPVTKALLTKFGGPSMTGLYDLAMRWVITVRELLVQSNAVLVPTVSNLQERDPASIPGIYGKSYQLIFYLAIPSFTFVVILSPIVSAVWLGRCDPIFLEFVALLSAGWLVNVLSSPAYVIDLGTGALRWVSAGCLLTAVLNAGLGLAAGRFFGIMGVVLASVSSLAIGYALIVIQYHVENRVRFRALIPPASAGILAASAVSVTIFLLFFRAVQVALLFSARMATGLCAVLLAIIVLMWMHPMRRRVWVWVTSRAPA